MKFHYYSEKFYFQIYILSFSGEKKHSFDHFFLIMQNVDNRLAISIRTFY